MNFYRNAADVGISTLLNMDRNRNTISTKSNIQIINTNIANLKLLSNFPP